MAERTERPELHSFGYGIEYLIEAVADLDDAAMVAQPAGLRSHPAWLVGHLTFTCQALANVLGEQDWLPSSFAGRFGTGSVPLADVSAYETKGAALARLRDAAARLANAVRAFPEAGLDGPFPDPAYREVFPTIRHALTQVLVGHTAYHVGQLVWWRKALGLAPPGRPFE